MARNAPPPASLTNGINVSLVDAGSVAHHHRDGRSEYIIALAKDDLSAVASTFPVVLHLAVFLFLVSHIAVFSSPVSPRGHPRCFSSPSERYHHRVRVGCAFDTLWFLSSFLLAPYYSIIAA
ncbi:uncharacterized protein LY79DRAFT_547249 [Colletotrichum navitas]|uniref:Uncharacterized protein n=1 Tax=Colletotrichum navitas TaxID=681940 RepID=A0AAD8V8B4_9PEZI|nr:uncharacterized protein LY79DRAFT_547249 [Colletotrichum navitas]KAK1595280.1 hypothetical protein LY79DRAFT_547249 [Colletotrichum navitas]